MRQKSIRRRRAAPTPIVIEIPALFTGLSRQQLIAGDQRGRRLERKLRRQIGFQLELRINQENRPASGCSSLEQHRLLRERQRRYQHQPGRRPSIGLQQLQISV